jgi:Ran GTPase-activating protein (RanGAP) involved in mRNA processing and transport
LVYCTPHPYLTIWTSSGMGVLVEAWKVSEHGGDCVLSTNGAKQVTKAVNINLIPAPAGSTLPYKIQITGSYPISTSSGLAKKVTCR